MIQRERVREGYVVRIAESCLYYPRDTAERLSAEGGVPLQDAYIWEGFDIDDLVVFEGEEVQRVRIHTTERFEVVE